LLKMFPITDFVVEDIAAVTKNGVNPSDTRRKFHSSFFILLIWHDICP
jgi:hypothetical protein